MTYVLAMEGSEDVSDLLVRPKAAPSAKPYFGPQDAVEWVIDIGPRFEGTFRRADILGVFERDWRQKNDWPTIYGRAVADKAWTYVDASNVPDDYDQLALGFDFTRLGKESFTEFRLNEIVLACEAAAKLLGAGSTKARLSAREALARARELDELRDEYDDARAEVRLLAPEGETFDGKTVWDVMQCLGLHWGDMDIFHWENEDDSRGDDHLFSVCSSTSPGYFIPNEIADDRVHVGDLIFAFSIPRSADPAVVLEGMLAAATYTQTRLGGRLVDGKETDLDRDALRKQVAEVTIRLVNAGFPPGHHHTMVLL
ncbi:Cell division protein ZipA [Labilithrix luteola]|uniref:Cell division protein ZipA n=1 Tax=Labilithrix luteola TaxID=1391654 RepID=A0A0K1PQP5_9BACT|nr:cell division protein ZipA C-terminal FtsZ-binding domain-containing protein [Labilithrix luteola]AKU95847.1 Cell division protein ZipA [Labilithrix luteola]